MSVLNFPSLREMGSLSSSEVVAFHVKIRQTVTFSDLPSCALSPAIGIIGETGCGTDIACVCKNSSFFSSFTTQIQAACSTADFGKAIIIGDQLCSQAGVTIASAYVSAASTYVPVSALPASSLNTSTSAITTLSGSAVISDMTTSYPSTSPSAVTVTSTLPGSVSISTVSVAGTASASIASTSMTTTTSTANGSPSLSSGAIEGIAVGGAVATLMILSLLLWFLILGPRRKKRRVEASLRVLQSKEIPGESHAAGWPLRQELPG